MKNSQKELEGHGNSVHCVSILRFLAKNSRETNSRHPGVSCKKNCHQREDGSGSPFHGKNIHTYIIEINSNANSVGLHFHGSPPPQNKLTQRRNESSWVTSWGREIGPIYVFNSSVFNHVLSRFPIEKQLPVGGAGPRPGPRRMVRSMPPAPRNVTFTRSRGQRFSSRFGGSGNNDPKGLCCGCCRGVLQNSSHNGGGGDFFPGSKTTPSRNEK